MGRTKQATPQRRTMPPESENDSTNGAANGSMENKNIEKLANGHVNTASPAAAASQGSFVELVICVGGIYMSL